MGTTKYNNLPLFSGFKIRISNKEVELVDPVSSHLVPKITGADADEPFELDDESAADWDIAVTTSPARAVATSSVVQMPSPETTNSPSVSRKFVAPTAFYGAPPPLSKKKPDAPLYVLTLLLLFFCVPHNVLGMTPTKKALL
jgi:DNA repair and recombination protein RAD54B